MTRRSLISSLYVDSMHRKCIEPVKRTHGNGPQWQSHRFAIKGGISFREAMLRDLAEPNVLLVAWRVPPGERAPLFGDVSFRGIPVWVVNDLNACRGVSFRPECSE